MYFKNNNYYFLSSYYVQDTVLFLHMYPLMVATLWGIIISILQEETKMKTG